VRARQLKNRRRSPFDSIFLLLLGLFIYAHDTCVLEPLDGEGFNTHGHRLRGSNSSVNNTPAEKIDWKGSAFEQNQYNTNSAAAVGSKKFRLALRNFSLLRFLEAFVPFVLSPSAAPPTTRKCFSFSLPKISIIPAAEGVYAPRQFCLCPSRRVADCLAGMLLFCV
jgi:hypothetical protein